MILFCLPCAGGNANVYNHWVDSFLAKGIKVVPICFYDEHTFTKKVYYENIEELASIVKKVIIDNLPDNKTPFAILGHSMGGMVAYELAKGFDNEYRLQLKKIIICGTPAPNNLSVYLKETNLDNIDDIKELVLKIGYIDSDIFDTKMYQSLFLPILQNDFKMISHYRPVIKEIGFDILVFSGKNDRVVLDKDRTWGLFSKIKKYKRIEVMGGHFFLSNNEFPKILLNEIC